MEENERNNKNEQKVESNTRTRIIVPLILMIVLICVMTGLIIGLHTTNNEEQQIAGINSNEVKADYTYARNMTLYVRDSWDVYWILTTNGNGSVDTMALDTERNPETISRVILPVGSTYEAKDIITNASYSVILRYDNSGNSGTEIRLSSGITITHLYISDDIDSDRNVVYQGRVNMYHDGNKGYEVYDPYYKFTQHSENQNKYHDYTKGSQSYPSCVSYDENDATCEEPGGYGIYCYICGYSDHVDTEPVTDHDYEETYYKAATCTEKGYWVEECSMCGDTNSGELSALGHNYTSKITKYASCTEDGIRTYTCSRGCGEGYEDTIPSWGGHVWSGTLSYNGEHFKQCENCSEKEILDSKHNASVTGTVGVFNYSTCSICGWTNSNGTFTSGMTSRDTDSYSTETNTTITFTFTATVESTLSFDLRVSSEEGCDEILIDLDGTNIINESGEVGWTNYSNTNVPAGSHTLTVKYEKDASSDDGEDLAQVRNLSLIPNIATYKVQHWQQKLTGTASSHNSTNYTLIEKDTENKTGRTNTKVTPERKNYTGFTAPSGTEVTIKVDGTAEVNYYYTRNSYTVTVDQGTGIASVSGANTYLYGASVTINATVSEGYTWKNWTGKNTTNTKEYTFTMPAENITETANATANTNTAYKVQHWQQKLTGTANSHDSTNYTLIEKDTENKTGTTDTKVTPERKTYTGFTAPSGTEVTIKGDGTAEVNYYYTRNSYTVTVDPGTGIESVSGTNTYLYEASVTINATVSEGYTWKNWTGKHTTNTKEYTFTMPAEDITDTANATANTNTAYKVQHWQQKLTGTASSHDSTNYTLIEKDTENKTGTTDTQVTPERKTYTGFTAPSGTEVTIKGDGTAVVDYYYTRNSYTVTLQTNEGTINEGEVTGYTYGTEVTLPTDVTKTGYTFGGWYENSEFTGDAVTSVGTTEIGDKTYYAKWTANEDTQYIVKHWKQKLNANETPQNETNYTLAETENLTGATGATVTPNVKDYVGFIAPETEELTIQADGSSELNYCYKRRTDLSYTVKYLEKGTNKEIREEKTVGNKTFEQEITTSNEVINNIYGYNYDSVSAETLKITTEENILNIYYTKKDAKVIVHHYIYNGECTDTKLTPDVEIEGKVGDTYTTSKSSKVPSNYKCIEEEPSNYTGKMTEEPTEISYYYELTTPKVDGNIESEIITEIKKDEDGKYVIPEGEEIKYKIKYEPKVEDYIGKATIEITAKLPREIDLSKSDIKGGKYDEETNTIKWTEEREIDTYKDGNYTEKIEKEITIVYKEDITIENLGDIEIKVEGKTILYYPDNYPEKGGEIFVEQEKKENSKVIVHYYIYDIETEQETKAKLTTDEEIKGIVGDTYTTTKSNKISKNYEIINESPERYTGKFTKAPIEVSYYYKLKETKIEDNIGSEVITEEERDEGGKYVIENGKEIKYVVKYETKVEDYIGRVTIEITAKLPGEIDLSKSDIKGGKYDEETNTIKWTEEREIDTFEDGNYAEKIEKEITVVYKDDTILENIGIKVDGKTITYYPEEYLNKGGQTSENVKYAERKTGKITVKYIDIDTNEEITPVGAGITSTRNIRILNNRNHRGLL